MHPEERRIYVALLTAWAIIVLLGLFYITVIVLYQKKRVKAYLKATKAELSLLEEERTRISAELHDQAGGGLSALQLRLASFPSLSPEQQKLMEEATLLLQSIANTVRTVSYQMQPTALQTINLQAATEELLIPFYQSNLYRIDFAWETDSLQIEPEAAFHLYRIIQEVLTNVLKHAEANFIGIELYRKKGDVILSISDNGKGFHDSALTKLGLGLKNIRMRADLLQSSLTIDSKPNSGTHYVLCVPVKQLKREE